MTEYSFQKPILAISESIRDIKDEFYTTQKILLKIAYSENPDASKAKSAIVPLKNAKALFSQKSESLRKPLQSCYRHAADFALACQVLSEERDGAIKSCLDSAVAIRQDFSKFHDDFEKALIQFERQKPALTVSEQQEQVLISTNDHVEKLFTSLHSVQTNLMEILTFWGNHIHELSQDLTSSNDPNDNYHLAETWVGYQRDLLDATASIAESVDAMSVEPSMPLSQGALKTTPTEGQYTSNILRRLWGWATSFGK